MKEIRQINAPAKVEKRDDGSPGSIHGYAIVYNKKSEDMGFIERVKPGAAKNALKRSDIRALKNHDPSLIFARQGVNLTLKEDKDGLRYDATPINTANFREVAAEVEVELLTGQSFGFTILADEWKGLETDHPERTITEIGEIFDVGPCTYPAYPDTDVGLRVLAEARDRFSEKTPEPTITVTVDEEQHTFTGENRFDEAADKLNSFRSSSKPSLPDNDDNVPEPLLAEVVSDNNVLDKINETFMRYNK